MAEASKTYRVGFGPRLVNGVYARMARAGRGKPVLHVLSAPGRESGRRREIPLNVIAVDGSRYVAAIYGLRPWVANVRANDMHATLERGGHVEQVRLAPAEPGEAAKVLQRYVEVIPHVRPYLPLGDRPTSNEWLEAAKSHPVFRLEAQEDTA
jgi:deazaflavin-dependent oxidoreductase (nitroreductase family)